jgi:hypothetical protein
MTKHMIVVHADGETWTMASGAKLCEVTSKKFERLEAGEYPKNMRIKGLPLERLLVTKLSIFNAPMFTVFRGPTEKPRMQDDQWNLVSNVSPGTDAMCQLSKLGIQLIRGLIGEPLHVEKDDEFCAEDQYLDDLDATMAYLNNGGMVVKLPDAPTPQNQHFRMYAVACYKPVKK